jgi:quercetin dioxygenase-like cupin family protein
MKPPIGSTRNLRLIYCSLAAAAFGALTVLAADAAPHSTTPPASGVVAWESLRFTPTKAGERASAFDVPTGTLDKFHCHVSKLNPGQSTGAPHRHPQEEMVVVREGTLEVNIDGHRQTAGPGAMIFFAVNENENMTNVGANPAVYYVFQWFTPRTPAR